MFWDPVQGHLLVFPSCCFSVLLCSGKPDCSEAGEPEKNFTVIAVVRALWCW